MDLPDRRPDRADHAGQYRDCDARQPVPRDQAGGNYHADCPDQPDHESDHIRYDHTADNAIDSHHVRECDPNALAVTDTDTEADADTDDERDDEEDNHLKNYCKSDDTGNLCNSPDIGPGRQSAGIC